MSVLSLLGKAHSNIYLCNAVRFLGLSLSAGISGYSAHRTAAPPLTTTSDIAITRLLVIYGLHCVFRRRFCWLLCAIFVLYRGLSCCCLLIAILLPHWPVGCWLVVATYYLVLDLATRLVLIVHFQLLHFVHIVPFERLNFRKFRLIGFVPIRFNWVWKWENLIEIRKELKELSVYNINWYYFQTSSSKELIESFNPPIHMLWRSLHFIARVLENLHPNYVCP